MSSKSKFVSFISSKKFSAIFYPILYTAFAIAISVSGSIIFNNYYYKVVYIHGSSMMPTLLGEENRQYYGYADESKKAIDNINRFDVIVLNYPNSWHTEAGRKVKRVWGFPGETISLVSNSEGSTFTAKRGDNVYTLSAKIYRNCTFSYETGNYTYDCYRFYAGRRAFNTVAYYRNFTDYTLGPNEYFVMGDNWGGSTDSYVRVIEEGYENITYPYLGGRVVNILGVATYDAVTDSLVNKVPFKKPIYYF